MKTKHLVFVSSVSHREGEGIHDYLVYETHGPKATLLEVFRTLARYEDSLPAAADKGEILRLLEKNGTLVRNNGRRIFILVRAEGGKDVILDAHIGYHGSHDLLSKVIYQEHDPRKCGIEWFLKSGHYVLVRA